MFLPHGTFEGGTDTIVVQALVVDDFLVVRVTVALADLGRSVIVIVGVVLSLLVKVYSVVPRLLSPSLQVEVVFAW